MDVFDLLGALLMGLFVVGAAGFCVLQIGYDRLIADIRRRHPSLAESLKLENRGTRPRLSGEVPKFSFPDMERRFAPFNYLLRVEKRQGFHP